jgi:hypothetical protein
VWVKVGWTGIFPKLCTLDAFRARVEKQPCPIGQLKCPSHHFDLALAIFVQADHRLHGLRAEIVAGIKECLIEACCDGERLYDALLVRTPFISSTHG